MLRFLCPDMHELTLIHTDLKPENILLVSPDYIKVPEHRVCLSACTLFLLCWTGC